MALAMANPNGRHATPTDDRSFRPGADDGRFVDDDARYGREVRQSAHPFEADGGSHGRDAGGRQSDPYGQAQSGYAAGRTQGDPSASFQGRNPPPYDDRPGYDPRDTPLNQVLHQNPQPWPGANTKRRHNVGNYGYGSDSYSSNGGSMLDQNQGVGQQGHFGGAPGGYGHVGSYGAEGGAQNHGGQGWQGNQSWEGRQPSPQPRWPQPPGPHRGKGPKNFQRTDERIREAVSEALEIHDHLDATHIEVLVKGGEVTLSGTVEDRQTKRLAEDVTAAVSGVRDVQNQLRVGAPGAAGPSPTSEASDARKARA